MPPVVAAHLAVDLDAECLEELGQELRLVFLRRAGYNEYEPTKAGRLISDFVNDNLSNWYVRLNRKRFWGGEFTQDKLSAYQTLYTCLETVAKLMAPVSPFYADRLYTDLITATGRDNVVSVHLAEFPKYQEEMIDKELEARMQMAQDVTSMVLALRRKVNIKVRQPLQCIMVPVVDEEQKAHIEAVKNLIMNEVNVKEVRFVDGAAGVLVKKVIVSAGVQPAESQSGRKTVRPRGQYRFCRGGRCLGSLLSGKEKVP